MVTFLIVRLFFLAYFLSSTYVENSLRLVYVFIRLRIIHLRSPGDPSYGMVVVVAPVWKNRDGSVGLGGGGGMDGKDLCTTARATPLSIPVWYVCSRGEDKDEMSGLRWKVISQKTLPAKIADPGPLKDYSLKVEL